MNIKKLEELKNRYSDKVSEEAKNLKNIKDIVDYKELFSNNSKLNRVTLFSGISYLVCLLTAKSFNILSPEILSLTFPLIISSSGYLLSKGYEIILLNGSEKTKTEKTILEEEFNKSIEEQISLSMTQIYTQCNNNFYAKEQIYKKFDKMGTSVEFDKRDIKLVKEKLIALKVILDEDNAMLKKLCSKMSMLSYFNDYNSTGFIKTKEFFRTNLITLITMLGTSVFFVINKMPIDVLSLLVSSSVVGYSYGNLFNKSNNDSFNVFEKVKEKYDFKGLEDYETLDDIECKITLLCTEISKIKTMIEEEEIYLEEEVNNNKNNINNYELENENIEKEDNTFENNKPIIKIRSTKK